MRRRATKTKPRKKKRMTKAMRRKQLERATAAYFASLSPAELREENELGKALSEVAGRVNYDADY